jgi:cytochrome c2
LLVWTILSLDCAPCPGAELQRLSVTGNPAHGRDLFIQKGCLSCHSVRGSGSKLGPDLAAALVGKGIVGIAAAMLSHYPGMRAAMQEKQGVVPHLSAAELDDMVRFLVFINFAREPGSAENGEALFSQKGCIGCHGRGGNGASIGPPLGRGSLSAPPIMVAQEMWNHSTQMNARMRETHVQRSTFQGREMVDLLAFLTGPPEPLPGRGTPLPGDPVVGRDLFRSKGCARCHLRRETGKNIGPDLSTTGWYRTATEIAGAMWNHEPAMWARRVELGSAPPRFENDEMADVIAYLYLLRNATRSGNPAQGQEVFDKGQCAQCHKRGGTGPDLAAIDHLDTPIHLAAAMWNHGPRMEAFLTKARLPWPTFDASDITSLVAFLHRQSGDHE